MEDKDKWYPRLNVPLATDVRAALEALSAQEARSAGRQAAALIQEGLERRKLLPQGRQEAA